MQAHLAVTKNLGGVMLWSLAYDDIQGTLGVKNVLLRAINKVMVSFFRICKLEDSFHNTEVISFSIFHKFVRKS